VVTVWNKKIVGPSTKKMELGSKLKLVEVLGDQKVRSCKTFPEKNRGPHPPARTARVYEFVWQELRLAKPYWEALLQLEQNRKKSKI